MSRGHFNRTQLDLIDSFEAGDIGEVEFFELAFDAGMSLAAIDEILKENRFDWSNSKPQDLED